MTVPLRPSTIESIDNRPGLITQRKLPHSRARAFPLSPARVIRTFVSGADCDAVDVSSDLADRDPGSNPGRASGVDPYGRRARIGFRIQVRRAYGPIEGLALASPDDARDVASAPPPTGALILFNGNSLDEWVKVDGKTAPGWKVLPGGVLKVVPKQGNLITRHRFDGHFKLHVEFRVPYVPTAKGQARGNSGIYLQGRYEVQILDSYGLKSQDNDCGGIYNVAAPRVNACKAPTVWQSYDIDFRAPRFANGKRTEIARISVVQNGVLIQDDIAIPLDNTTSGLGGNPSTPGPIMLQDHGNLVQYRNIWLQTLPTP